MYVAVVYSYEQMYVCICNCFRVYMAVCVYVCVYVLLVMVPRGRNCFWLWKLLLLCGLPLSWQGLTLVRPSVAPAAARGLPGPPAWLRQPAPAVAGQRIRASGYLATSALATGRRRAGGRKPEAGDEASRGLVCARTPSAAARWPGPVASVTHGGGASAAAARGGPGPELALVGTAPHPASCPSF